MPRIFPALSSLNPHVVQAIVDMFNEHQISPALGLAIAYVESDFDPEANKTTGGDGVRGGAYGLCQLTFKTAQGLDRTVSQRKLLDPEYNAHLAAQLCAQNLVFLHRQAAHGLVTLWSLELIEDLAAMYNSGKTFDKAPSSTKTDYVPAVVAAYTWFVSQLDVGLPPPLTPPAEPLVPRTGQFLTLQKRVELGLLPVTLGRGRNVFPPLKPKPKPIKSK